MQQCKRGMDSQKLLTCQQKGMERPAEGRESRVSEGKVTQGWIRSTAGHEKSGGKMGGPPSKPKYYPVTDRGKYCEGKVKSTPEGE